MGNSFISLIFEICTIFINYSYIDDKLSIMSIGHLMMSEIHETSQLYLEKKYFENTKIHTQTNFGLRSTQGILLTHYKYISFQYDVILP